MKLKILLVDDVQENIFSLKALLQDNELEVVTATNGADALKVLISQDISLAILDIMMPDMDGFELAELMRGLERTKNIPIIFLTAANHTLSFEFKGYESGAVDVLFKPVNSSILKAKVEVFKRLAQKKILLKQKLDELELTKMAAESARKKAEESDRFKSSFLAQMSHEIRTPLGALLGFAELLSADNQSLTIEQRERYLKIILRNGNNLLELINDILDLSKVESGQLDMFLSPLDIRTLVRQTLESLKSLAEKSEVHLQCSFSDNLPETIGTDSKRIRQVLINLISNGIKFSSGGTVKLGVTYDAQSELLKFNILDNGIGMSKERIGNLFKPFHQLNTAISEKYGGTGLGLSLSRELARLMGGDIELVSSKPEVGTEFLFFVKDLTSEIPVSVAIEDKPMVQAPLKFDGIHILLVDDSEDNRLLLSTVLEQKGANVDTAENGEQAVSKASEKSYDLILMDHQMPKLTGWDATRILRRQGYEEPIISLTANAMKEDQERALKAGSTAYLSKPIDFNQLFLLIDQCIKVPGSFL